MSRFAAAIVIVFLASTWSWADQAQIKQLHHKITELRHQRNALVKETRARYHAISKKTIHSEEERRQLRHRIHLEEERLVAMTQDPASKQKIRQEYDNLRHAITKGIHLDEATRQKIVAQGRAQVHTIEATYNAQIRDLERQIHVLRSIKTAQAKSKKK